ncbi:hypothetical protein IT775_20950 [Thalassobius aquimarinus]|uniref:Metal-dependent hydrolase n=2 Tax=Thalassovita aquimarina TaxID=2785917 RepID=A0ABS5HXC2_9RHOB|nr:hypothetical protein [Thalassovita aquimarina]
MQAINHAATALILKRKFPSAPLMGLILATEAVEYLWVGLNIIGVEKTIVDTPMKSVADVHLVHMPFSHSIATSVIIAALVGLIVFWRSGKAASAVSIAIGLGVFSHIVLDLLVHAPDIALTPLIGSPKFGTGLYSNLPLPALVLETLWGVFCWYYYRGSKKLLGLILALGAASIPIYSAAINIGEAALSGHNVIFAFVIMGQMVATSALVWIFAREKDDQAAIQAAV